MATYTDKVLVLDATGTVTKVTSADTVEFGGDVVVGNLSVTGTKFTNSAETVLVADNHTYVNAGYTTNSAQTGGLVVNYLPTSTTDDTVGAGVFTAGSDGVSDPTVTTQGAATFSAGDLVQISGSAENDGLYEVHTHSIGTLTIRSTADGVTNQVEDFTDGQFVANAGDTGATITKVTVSVIRAGTDGVWESGSGSAAPLSFSDFATGTSTLQNVYEAGNTITTSPGQGNFDVSGTAAISLDASLASNFTVTGADLGLGTATSGTLNLIGADAINLDSAGQIQINSSGAGIGIGNDNVNQAINLGTAGTRTITLGSAAADIVASSGTLDVPAGTSFKIGTNALTTANFTAANLDTLLDGSNADSLHEHAVVVNSQFVAETGGVSAGDALYLASGTEVGLADATTADGKNFVVGFATNTATATNTVNMNATPGATITTGTITGFSSAGDAVYLSETAGALTTTAPSSSGTTIFKVGYAVTSTSILFQPQLVAVNP